MPGKHQIQDDEVVLAVLGPLEAGLAVRDGLDFAIDVLQMERDQVGDVLVVFDDEHSLPHGCR